MHATFATIITTPIKDKTVIIIRYSISVETQDVVLPVITNFQFRRTVAIVAILMQMERKEMRKTTIE